MKLTQATMALTGIVTLSFASMAQAQVLDATGRGYFTNFGFNNGNTPGLSFVAGNVLGVETRDHFDFSIPTLGDEIVTGAVLELDEPDGILGSGHNGPTETYSLYSLGAFGTYGFNQIGTGTFYGSVAVSGSSDGTTVLITLDSAAIAAIQADSGQTFSLGGVDSREGNHNNNDFNLTVNVPFISDFHARLDLTTVPEPGVTPLLCSVGLMGVSLLRRRRAR